VHVGAITGLGVWHALTDEDHVFQEKFKNLVSSLQQLIDGRTRNQQQSSLEIVFMHQYPINEEGYHFPGNDKFGHDLTSDKIFRYNNYIRKSLK